MPLVTHSHWRTFPHSHASNDQNPATCTKPIYQSKIWICRAQVKPGGRFGLCFYLLLSWNPGSASSEPGPTLGSTAPEPGPTLGKPQKNLLRVSDPHALPFQTRRFKHHYTVQNPYPPPFLRRQDCPSSSIHPHRRIARPGFTSPFHFAALSASSNTYSKFDSWFIFRWFVGHSVRSTPAHPD